MVSLLALLNLRGKFDHKPILWRYKWPDDIIVNLVTTENPSGTVTNSDLELAGGLIHLEAIIQTFHVRECTFLSKTDKLATLFWQRKGSAKAALPLTNFLPTSFVPLAFTKDTTVMSQDMTIFPALPTLWPMIITHV